MSSWKDIGKKVIGTGLPVIGNLLGGGAGEKVGNIVAGVLGVDPDPDTVLKRIEEDPGAAVKLQKYEYDHKEELESLELQETKAYLADRQSARARETAIVQATGKADKNVTGLAWLVVLGFMVMTGILMFKGIAPGSTGVEMMLFGTLSTGFGTVLGYFFGTSKSSKDKDHIIANGKH